LAHSDVWHALAFLWRLKHESRFIIYKNHSRKRPWRSRNEFPVRYKHHLHKKGEAIPITGRASSEVRTSSTHKKQSCLLNRSWKSIGEFSETYEHHLHIEKQSCLLNRPWKSIDVFSVRYEHHLHTFA
jgi:hypothetical protein